MSITPEEQKAWNESIREQNAAHLAEATKSHKIKQEVAQRLFETARWVADQYPIVDDGTRPMPESINDLFAQLQQIRRSLEKGKEQIPLLGQSVPALKVELPEWAELKNS